MDLEFAIKIGTLISAVAGILTLFIGIRIYKRQTNTQIFLEYTKRYNEIMESFPPEARPARLSLEGKMPDHSEGLSISILRYLNLCSEEYYLCKRGYLSKELWEIWEDELKRTLNSPLFVREWKDLRNEFLSYPEFLEFVDDTHRSDIGKT
jgi:hypothetical protein